MNKTTIEFTAEEFDKILAYMDKTNAETVQEAILDAIEKAGESE